MAGRVVPMLISRLSLVVAEVAVLWVAVLAGCDDGAPAEADPKDACRRGAVRACTGAGDCAGTRTCTGLPADWSACRCRAPEPAEPDAGELPTLGASCAGDEDCPADAFCLDQRSDLLFGGGAPEGTCVADCGDDANTCDRFADAVCVATGVTPSDAGAGTALCFERCRQGSVAGGKCHDRATVGCASVDDADGGDAFCRPLCASDEPCGGRKCHPALGVCVDEAPVDRDFGQRCDLETGDDDGDAGTPAAVECAGLCVQLNDAPVVCSRRCVFGEASECAPASGGLRRGACVFAAEGGGIGDVGYCGELCDCNADCIEPTFVCDAFDDETLEQAFGREGVCTDPQLVTTRELVCES